MYCTALNNAIHDVSMTVVWHVKVASEMQAMTDRPNKQWPQLPKDA